MQTILKASLKNKEEQLFVDQVVAALKTANVAAQTITIDRKTRAYGSSSVASYRARVDKNGVTDIWVNLGILSNTNNISMSGGLTTSQHTKFIPKFEVIEKIVEYSTSTSTTKFFAKYAKQ